MKTTSKLFDLSGRDIWVFGGAGWLGAPLVELLAESGARVLCADLDSRAYEWVEKEGLENSVTPESTDVTDLAGTRAFIEARLRERGVPHGLAILTTGTSRGSFEELTPEQMAHTNHASLSSTFFIARDVGRAMVTRGRGNIVLFSSMYGIVAPDPGAYTPPITINPIDYGVSKAGIIQMTRYLAVYWAETGVRCNCIAPGPFPRESVQNQSPVFIERLAKKVPMGRIGRRHEIAGPTMFLLSDASSYVTGHTLAVDGGWTAW